MTETIVRLAGSDYAIRPLTLGQLRVVLEVVAELPGKSGGALVEAAARIIHAGLSRAVPDLTLDGVLAMEAGLDEVNAAVAAILKSAGLTQAGSGAGGDSRAQLAGIYGALATGCGYPHRVIDAMTLAEAEEIFDYWAVNPPTHLMIQTIAAMLGWKPRTRPEQGHGLAEMAGAPPPGLTVTRDGSGGMPAPILDITALRAVNAARQKSE